MKVKQIYSTLLVALVLGFAFSCDDNNNDVPLPEIGDFELGIGNSHVSYAGSDMHIEAEVIAEDKIETIEVEIHKENESEGWAYDTVYTKFSGLLNTTFHEHIDIPFSAELGEYHFHFTVTDMLGQQTVMEIEDFDIQEIVDETVPTITVAASPSSGEVFNTDDTITIEGTVSDNVTLSGMFIGLVRSEDSIADADVSGGNTSVIPMLHTHDFDYPSEHDFSASIVVGAEYDNNMTPALIEEANAWKSADYYILIRVKDQSGNWAFASHYPLVIEL